jgi:hypothetical protein
MFDHNDHCVKRGKSFATCMRGKVRLTCMCTY